LAIAHLEEESRTIVLDRIEERRPPLAPQDVVREYAAIIKAYNVHRIIGDRYAGDWVSAAFQEESIYFKASDKDKSAIYLEFEPLIAQGRVELLDNRYLCSQFRNLERRTRPGGKDRVDHIPGAKDDLANACAGACVIADKDEGSYHRLVEAAMCMKPHKTQKQEFNEYVYNWLMDIPQKPWSPNDDGDDW
jgi:hypothetical protein